MLSQDSCHNGSHLASTYSALALLKILGYDLANIDSKSLLLSMKKLQQPDGRQVFRFGLPSHSYQTCILLHLLTLSREQLHPPFILFYDFFNILQLVHIPDFLGTYMFATFFICCTQLFHALNHVLLLKHTSHQLMLYIFVLLTSAMLFRQNVKMVCSE